MSLNPPLELPKDWSVRIVAINNANQTCVVSRYDAGTSSRWIQATSKESAEAAEDRRRFIFNHYYSAKSSLMYGHLFHQSSKSPCYIHKVPNPQHQTNPRLQTYDEKAFDTIWSFIPLENDAVQPDGPGYMRAQYQNPLSASDVSLTPAMDAALEASKDTHAPPTAWETRYLSIDPSADWLQVDLVKYEAAILKDITWQLYREKPRSDSPTRILEPLNITAISWAAANVDGMANSIYVLTPGMNAQRIRRVNYIDNSWVFHALPFGQPDDICISASASSIYSLTSAGKAYKYTQASDAIHAIKISKDSLPLSLLYVSSTDGTTLAIASGINSGKVYCCQTPPVPPMWTCLTSGQFYAKDIVGNQFGTFAISKQESEYGDADAIYHLANSDAALIGDASMNAISLLLTQKTLIAVCANNKCYAYNGTPRSWTDLTSPSIRPWGGIAAIVEDVNSSSKLTDKGRRFQALSGDGLELVNLRSDQLSWSHFCYVDVAGAVPVLNTGDVTLFQKSGQMYCLRG